MTEESRTAVIIEDDPDIRDLTEMVLVQSGFTVVTAEDGQAGIDAVREHDPLLTTLDVNMPGMDGFAVAKRLREFSHTYLIMVTALADEIDIISGFEAGADDYLTKPFRPRELRARADSMLRRPRLRTGAADAPVEVAPEPEPEPETWSAAAARELRDSPLAPIAAAALVDMTESPSLTSPSPSVDPIDPAAPPSILRFRGLVLDPASGRATLDGRGLDLARPELDLLIALMTTGRRVRSKADLVLALRGQPYVTSYFVKEADKRNVDAHVAGLRKKLGDDGDKPRYVETVKGVGYRMAEAG